MGTNLTIDQGVAGDTQELLVLTLGHYRITQYQCLLELPVAITQPIQEEATTTQVQAGTTYIHLSLLT